MELIQFDGKKIRDLSFSLSREYLETNDVGAYSSSSIINCHTRRYHGLLCVRQPQLGADNYVLLSNLDETIRCNGESHQLATHQYPGNIEPKGYNSISSFSLLKVPTWEYKIGEVVLKKELLLVSNKNQLLIRYTIIKGNDVNLKLEPFTAFRRIHDLAYQRNVPSESNKIDNGILVKMDDGYDGLNLQFSKQVHSAYEPMWFYKTQYLTEKERGYDFEEDLYRVGYFTTSLNEGESLVFSASINDEKPEGLKSLFETEIGPKIELTDTSEVLDRAAKQFISKTERGTEVCAGFHWFGRWGRDTFISLPGLTLARGGIQQCIDVIDTMMADLEGGLLTNIGVGNVKEYNSVDASLWFFWTLCELQRATKDYHSIWERYGEKMKAILTNYRQGTMYNIQMDDDGLLSCGAEGVALTWMDAKVDGEPVTPRRGKPVEINSLWYNAVAFSLDCAERVGDDVFIKEWSAVKNKIEISFIEQFWDDDKGYLADVVSSEGKDWSIRPNQVFSISLPYSLIRGEKAKSILRVVEAELYTTSGMRTLSPKDSAYVSNYFGDQKTRDNSYHQGIIWPWLIGSYCEASLKVNGSSFLQEIQKINDNFTLEFSKEGLATISELYHNEVDLESVGTISQAWSISELIRINKLAEDYK
jgi:predicted glycogen debranching enzyme